MPATAKKPRSRKGVVYFSIEGEFITNLMHDLVLEERWEDALRILRQSLPGITYDQCILILKGEAKLVGVNEVDFVPDDDQEYKKRLQWLFAGFVRYRNRWYQPYAVVTNYGYKDWIDEHTEVKQLCGFFRCTGREKHYMDNAGTDESRGVDYDGTGVACLWKQVSSAPVWLGVEWERGPLEDSREFWQLSLDNFLAHRRRIDKRGHKEWYGEEPEPHWMKAEEPAPKVEPEEKEEKLPEIDRELESLHGWLSPDGAYYPCDRMGHVGLAYSLLRILYNEDVWSVPDQKLYEKGWVAIKSSLDGEPWIGKAYDAKTRRPLGPNSRQDKIIADWSVKHNTRIKGLLED